MRTPPTLGLSLSALVLTLTALSPWQAVRAQTPTAPDAKTVWTSYLAKLDAQCAGKHLNWYSPADLNDIVEDFTQHLTIDDRKTVQQFTNQSCRDVEAGVTCANTGFLQAAVQLNKLDDFVTRVCRVPMRCKEQSDCTNTN